MSMAHTELKDPARHTSAYRYTSPVEDLASFLLVRGKFAWLGAGWAGCDCYPPFYSGFERDDGHPMESYAETAAGSGVFAREWTKASVSFNCTSKLATIRIKEAAEDGQTAV
jgi:hypothetical protein